MKIDVAYLEELSYLTFADEEKVTVAGDLEKMLAQVHIITEVDTNGVDECVHPSDCVNVFREDVVVPSCDRALLLQNAANHDDEMFIAPKTVE
ncbi:MAG: Asp-tRNA(Asn)/Glu-tRNA(Gln) amidotransferase subunit GatC [Oscillospiraceae bacterium]|nr:Asp-tRNA(Asn)/Glu-tRNA(Gln) amidotransferase subunit GatC [Oscillospiraceae bacterium]